MTYIIRAKTITNQTVYFSDSYGGREDVHWTLSLIDASEGWYKRLHTDQYFVINVCKELKSAYFSQRVIKESIRGEN